MSLLAAHINDAGISVLSADRILYREPGFALLDPSMREGEDLLDAGATERGSMRTAPCGENRSMSL